MSTFLNRQGPRYIKNKLLIDWYDFFLDISIIWASIEESFKLLTFNRTLENIVQVVLSKDGLFASIPIIKNA